MTLMPVLVPVFLAAMSLLTFAIYALDKMAAREEQLVEALNEDTLLAGHILVNVVVRDAEAFLSGRVFDLRRYDHVVERAYVDGVRLVHAHELVVDPSAFSIPSSGS